MKKIILLLLLFNAQFINANTILFLGDSLTEGFGVSKQDAYPTLVETMIHQKVNKNIKIINGGVSGSTTSDGLARLRWYLKRKPDIVFIALGVNDGLRGLDLEKSQKNLEQIIEHAQKAKAKVLLAGMLLPPNYGPTYEKQFKQMYENLKVKYKLKTLPFLLDGVAGEKALNQSDGIHPNKEGHKHVAKNVFMFLKEEL